MQAWHRAQWLVHFYSDNSETFTFSYKLFVSDISETIKQRNVSNLEAMPEHTVLNAELKPKERIRW